MKTQLLKKVIYLTLLLFTTVLSNAQVHINYCEAIGGTGIDYSSFLIVDSSQNKYSIYQTNSSDFPVTSGTAQGLDDIVFRKTNASNQTVFSIRFGGDTTESPTAFVFKNNKLYILGFTLSSNFPVTDGSTYKGNGDAFLRVYSTDGTLQFSKLLGGGGVDNFNQLVVDDNDIYALGSTTSANITPTNSSTNGGDADCFIYRMNASGSITFSTYLGGIKYESITSASLYKDTLVVIGTTASTNFPVTTSDSLQNSADAFVYMANNSNVNYFCNYIGGNGAADGISKAVVDNGVLFYLLGTNSNNLPVSNGNPASGNYIGKMNLKGTPIFGSYFSYNNITGQFISDFDIEDGKMYFIASASVGGLPTTNGSSFGGASDIYYAVLNASNNLEFATYFGGTNSQEAYIIKRFNQKSYLFGIAESDNFPTTAGALTINHSITDVSYIKGKFGLAIFDGSVLSYSSPLPGNTRIYNFYANQDKLWFDLANLSYDFLLTTPWNNLDPINNDAAGYMELVLCKRMDITNTISPSTQTKCKQGLADLLVGNDAQLNSDSLPKLYARPQTSAVDEEFTQGFGAAKYQWQIATSASGPWSDIPAGILKDYLPSIGNVDQYYRRIVKGLSLCTVGDTSAVVSVLVNANTAPTVNAGGIIRTCPNVTVTIGGSPAASGGTSPYTYLWDQGAYLSRTNSSNPDATVAVNTVFELTVTDNNGCVQIDQVVVMAHRADAGPDKGACSGVATQIGGLPIAGLSGVGYSWTNSGTLTSGSVAQPMANPGSTTSYILTLTIPKTGGGTCSTNDTVVVTPVSITPGFAGADRVICRGSTTSLGASAQSGFSYTWAPGNYLTSNNASTTTFDAGSFFPFPNPFTYYVTAVKSGCTYVDDVVVSVLESNGAGVDGCGPRIVGISDLTPDINDTYAWVKLSGNGNFSSGATTNTPTSIVTATPSGSSTYQVTISYNGTSCVDQVIVPQCGCVLAISASSPVGCPKFSLGPVTLTATGASIENADPNAYTYNWSPSAGLSSATGRTVSLTDNVQRTYTVTVTSPYDGTFNCQASIAVNNPAWSLPTFNANSDTVCAGTTVNVGQSSVAGYSYLWSGSSGLSSTTISNPSVTPTSTKVFYVKVTDVGSGCFAYDTSDVMVREVTANAGPDWTVCQNGLIELGTPAIANYSYFWLPSSTWQNSTTQTSAQPQVRVSTNIQYDVRVTDNVTGCIKRDTVQVTVSNTPTLPNAPDVTICKNVGRTIGSPAMPGVAYSWSPTTGLSCSNCAQPVATPASTTVYTCTATFLGNCSSNATDQVTVTVSDPSFTMADITYCPSDGATSLGSGTPNGMSSYSWTPVEKVSNAGIQNPSTNVSQTTKFTLTVVNSSNCSATATRNVGPSALAPNAGADRTTCVGTTITIGDPNNIGTLTWTSATGLSSTSAPAPTFSTSTPGTYTKVLTQVISDKFGSCTVRDTMIITVVDFSIPTLPTATNVCQGACTEIGFNPTMGIEYIWSPSTGLSSTTSSLTTACVTSSTEYTLTAINAYGCVLQAQTTVAVSPVAAPTVTIPNLILCLGGSGDTLRPVISPSGTYTYSWTPPYALNNVNVLNPKVTPITSGSTVYTLTATNTSNGCSGFGTVQVDVISCTPLPVDLITFGAQWDNKNGLVKWTTASEINNSHFEIWRSIDGKAFEYIGSQVSKAAGGNSMSILNYEFKDLDVYEKIVSNVYYKLIQHDFNGEFQDHGIVNLGKKSIKGLANVVLYPNPSNGLVKLNASGFEFGQVTISISDITGKNVYQSTKEISGYLYEEFNFDIFKDGIYLITISDGTQAITKRVSIIK